CLSSYDRAFGDFTKNPPSARLKSLKSRYSRPDSLSTNENVATGFLSQTLKNSSSIMNLIILLFEMFVCLPLYTNWACPRGQFLIGDQFSSAPSTFSAISNASSGVLPS